MTELCGMRIQTPLPPQAGRWLMPGSEPPNGVYFYMVKKPNWLHRTTMRLLLGWKWEAV